MTDKYWILNGRKTVRASSLQEWAQWFETGDNRHVDETIIGNARVSTVFLGVDHNHFGHGEPLLFETMIFGGPHDEYQTRCSTWDQAEAQHAEACRLVKTALH